MTYEILDDSKGFKVIGSLVAHDIVCRVEEFDETKLQREQDEGRLRDFIVISQEVEQIPGTDYGDFLGIDFLRFMGDRLRSDEEDSIYNSDGSDDSDTASERIRKWVLEFTGEGSSTKAWLNLMMIQFDGSQPGMASRLGILSISEEVWEGVQTEWKTIVLQ
jgi:hypothetical protein